MIACRFPARLTRAFLAALPFFLLTATPAGADELPPFVMPAIAPWPKPAATLPALIGERDLAAVTAKAEAGDIHAQMQLVRYYVEIIPAQQGARNLELAKAWNEKAAATGEPNAIFMQAVWGMQEDGLNDHTFALLEKAARTGSGMAAHNLGNYYRHENPQPARAIHWYRVAAKNRFQPAATELAELYYPIRTGQVTVRPDIVTGYAWRILAQKSREQLRDKTPDTRDFDVRDHAEELVMMQFFLMPSEKKAALDMLTAWPDQLPPEGDTTPLPDEYTPRHRTLLSEETAAALYHSAIGGDRDAINAYIDNLVADRLGVEKK